MPKKGEKATTEGRKDNQKMKPYLVYQYLLHHSDENHTVTAFDICSYLQEKGINAERRSIYKDIAAINDALWLLEDNDHNIEDLADAKEEDGDYEDTIVYDRRRKDKGFYVDHRKYDAADIRLISECIYSSKYISQAEAERLVSIMKDFVSDRQAAEIRTDALVNDRTRTLNKYALSNVSIIYDAMSRELNGERHTPEKIRFQYQKSQISDLSHQVERKHGAKYVVSPWKLIINDGNYYLLAFSDEYQEMRTYRVDRMKSIVRTGVPREGREAFEAIDLKSYTQRTFSMFNGEKVRVQIRFRNPLLDAVLERLGKEKTIYKKADDYHFTVSAEIEISDQFFGWICGFGNQAIIMGPESVQKQFTDYIDKIRARY
jgi:predicted DNA-binding transcriptional regulator YafY